MKSNYYMRKMEALK